MFSYIILTYLFVWCAARVQGRVNFLKEASILFRKFKDDCVLLKQAGMESYLFVAESVMKFFPGYEGLLSLLWAKNQRFIMSKLDLNTLEHVLERIVSKIEKINENFPRVEHIEADLELAQLCLMENGMDFVSFCKRVLELLGMIDPEPAKILCLLPFSKVDSYFLETDISTNSGEGMLMGEVVSEESQTNLNSNLENSNFLVPHLTVSYQ